MAGMGPGRSSSSGRPKAGPVGRDAEIGIQRPSESRHWRETARGYLNRLLFCCLLPLLCRCFLVGACAGETAELPVGCVIRREVAEDYIMAVKLDRIAAERAIEGAQK
jgi:hypothetical protein